MKSLFLGITAVFCIFVNAQNKNDLQVVGLKGKVKSVRQIPYEVIEQEGEIRKGNIMNYSVFTLYNENGNKSQERQYFSNGKLYYTSQYLYDDKGNLTEENVYNSDEVLYYKYVYQYNDKGKVKLKKITMIIVENFV